MYWSLVSGSVRPQSLQRPSIPTTTTTTTTLSPPETTATSPTTTKRGDLTTTECPPNATSTTLESRPNSNNLLRKLASSHYQSYTTALTVTIAVGCFLLLLNVLIFAGIYHQRDRSSNEKRKKKREKEKEELAEVNSSSSSSGDAEAKQALVESMSSHCMTSSSTMVDLPLQEFKSSPPSGARRSSNCPPSYCNPPEVKSPSIPDPPPPPKAQPPLCNQSGILRQQGCPQTPSTMKKRVQIQEISV